MLTAPELEAVDFRPFHALRDAPLAMTAHVFAGLRRPATGKHLARYNGGSDS